MQEAGSMRYDVGVMKYEVRGVILAVVGVLTNSSYVFILTKSNIGNNRKFTERRTKVALSRALIRL